MLRTLKPQESVVKVMKYVREAIQQIFVKEVTTKDNSYKSHLPLNTIPYAQQEREVTLGNRSKNAEIRHSSGYIDTVNCYSGVVTRT
jgi:hypothetical protein